MKIIKPKFSNRSRRTFVSSLLISLLFTACDEAPEQRIPQSYQVMDASGQVADTQDKFMLTNMENFNRDVGLFLLHFDLVERQALAQDIMLIYLMLDRVGKRNGKTDQQIFETLKRKMGGLTAAKISEMAAILKSA